MMANMIREGVMNLICEEGGVWFKMFGTVHQVPTGRVVMGALVAVAAVAVISYWLGKWRALKELAKYEPDIESR